MSATQAPTPGAERPQGAIYRQLRQKRGARPAGRATRGNLEPDRAETVLRSWTADEAY